MMTDLVRRYAGLTAEQIDQQVDDYHRFLAAGLAFRNGTPSLRVLPSLHA